MQQQFAKDQQRDSQAQSIGAEQVTLMDCIGYDTNQKGEAINIVINSSNSVISSAGQSITTPTTVTINIQDQGTIHYLHRYALSFRVNCVNGFFENGMNIWAAKSFTFAKGKTLSTGNAQYRQQQKLYTRKYTEILKHAKGLGLKVDGSFQNTALTLSYVGLLQNNAPATLVNNGNILSSLSLQLIQFGFTGIGQGFAGDTGPNQAATINTQIITPLRALGMVIPLLTAAELAAATNLTINAFIPKLVQQIQNNYSAYSRWQQYQNGLIANCAVQKNGQNTPLAQSYEFVVPLHYVFSEMDSPEFEAYLLHNGNTLQMSMTNLDPSQCMIALAPGYSYTIDSLSLVQVMSAASEQCLANVMRSNILYRGQRGYSMFAQCSESISLVAAIPAGTKCHGITFSFHPNQQYASQPVLQAVSDSTAENLVSKLPENTANFVYPLGFHCAMNIQQCVLTVSGITRLVNAYMLQNIEQQNYAIGGSTSWCSNRLQASIKQVYHIPLDRACIDLFGNSSLGPSPLNLQIILKADRTISGQGYDWSNGPLSDTAASLQRFTCYAYVDLVEIAELDKGIWK